MQLFNTDRMPGSIDDLTPLGLEQLDYARTALLERAGDTSNPLSGHAAGTQLDTEPLAAQ